MPEATQTGSAATSGGPMGAEGRTFGAPGSPQGAGKGGGGALPRSEYPFVPQWMQQGAQAAPQASRQMTPAINPGQGAGRFIQQSPAAPPPAAGGLMGRSATPTATPRIVPTQASAVLRPTITPSIYEQWKGWNAAAKQQAYDNPPPMTIAETIAAFDRGEVSRERYESALAAGRNEWHQDGAGG